MTDILSIYYVIPEAWRPALLCVAFALLLAERTLVQWSWYDLKTGGGGIGPLAALREKHDTDLFADPLPYIAMLLAGVDVFLLAGLSMSLRICVQGFGVNHGHGKPFLDRGEEAFYDVPLLGIDIPKPHGRYRIHWTALGLAILGARVATLLV